MSAQNIRREVHTHVLTPVALSVGDTVLYRVGVPIKIMRWGLMVTTTINSTAAASTYALDRRVLFGSDTGRVEMDRIALAAAEDITAGKVLRSEVGTVATETTGVDGSKVSAGGQTGHVCNVGDEIVLEVVVAADTAAGAAQPFFEYILLGAKDGAQTDATDK